METNVGVLDGAARLIAGVILLAASYGKFGAFAEGLGWMAWILGAFLAFTGLFRHCFFYRVLGMTSSAYGPSSGDE